MLGAVSMVNIPVDDHYSLHAEFFAGKRRRQGYIIKQTKAHGATFFGMVAGRPHQRERIGNLSGSDPCSGLQQTTYGKAGGSVRVSGCVGIAGQGNGIQSVGGFDFRNIFRRVNQKNFFNRRHTGGNLLEMLQGVCLLQHRIDRLKPLPAFRVAVVGTVIQISGIPHNPGALRMHHFCLFFNSITGTVSTWQGARRRAASVVEPINRLCIPRSCLAPTISRSTLFFLAYAII